MWGIPDWWKSYPRTAVLHGIVNVLKYLLQCRTVFREGILLYYV
jgi:hypothetical protein